MSQENVGLAFLVCEALKRYAREDDSFDANTIIYDPEGDDEHVDIDYYDKPMRIEVNGPFN